MLTTNSSFPQRFIYAGPGTPALDIYPPKSHTYPMDIGEVIYISSRLFLGALAAFFAIVLWSKTRDTAWMLMVIGTIVLYVEIVYSILNLFGIAEETGILIGSMPLVSLILPNLSIIFFIFAFMVMVVRKLRRQKGRTGTFR
jgi:hypothetical protein